MDRARLLAAILVLVAMASYTMATWTYLGIVGRVYGVFRPGGVLHQFEISVGEIYAGEIRTVHGNTSFYAPETTTATLYGVINSTIGFNYTVNVYIDGNYIGRFNQDANLTVSMSKGPHTIDYYITIYAPVNINETTPFEITFYIETG